VLPDKDGLYTYYNKDNLFPILKDNIDNGYIRVVSWDVFVMHPKVCMEAAFDQRDKTPSYLIKKSL
jgi:hypothetical protein